MTVKTLVTQFIAWLRIMLGDIYAWGAQGEDLTAMKDPEAWIKKVETSEVNANRAIALFRKRKAEGRNPIRAYDCSGLIVKWLLDNGLIKSDMSSRGLFAVCTEIKDRAALLPGDFVFRHNGIKIHHIGVYVGDGNVIECMGRDDGVVERDIDASGKTYWNRYGRFPALQTEVKEEPKMALVIKKNLTYSPAMKEYQMALNLMGYRSKDGKLLDEDGKCGDKTMEAHGAFMAAHSEPVEVPAKLPNSLAVAVEVNGAKYSGAIKSV